MNATPNIRREIKDDGIAVVTFDRPNSSANIFDRQTMMELDDHLDAIKGDAKIRGVVFVSAKPAIFIAGADLNALGTLSEGDLKHFIEVGQQVFNKIAELKPPTIAAIHGACVGGGYEMCLACDYRIASPDHATKIGLPETKLGILPAWGGSTRLPRLVGAPRALDVILGGKTVPAREALRYGMIDQIAPREYLLRAAERVLQDGLPARKRKLVTMPVIRGMVASLASPAIGSRVRKKTRGHYPAVEKALEVVVSGTSDRLSESLARERDAVIGLAQGDASKNLIRLFMQQERAKKFSIPGATETAVRKIEHAAVIGAGIMGSGIAQWLSARGVRVILRDVDPARVAAGMASIARLYAAGVKRHALTSLEARDGMDRISPTAADVSLRNVDLIIEAAVEKIDLKKQIFAQLDRQAGPNTILATNTSALSLDEIAAATEHPERVVGIHFFNPVHQMQLVEVGVGAKTSPDVAQRALKFVQQIGKLPIVVRDSPGFLVNRILLPYLAEAARCFQMGASVTEIDETMLEFGMPMGPLRLIDEVGVDIAADVAGTLSARFAPRLNVPEILPKMISAGMLGRKNGRGFYLHERGREARPNDRANEFRQGQGASSLDAQEIQRRMVLLMVNEAARCLEEKVVDSAETVDFGMVMGTGFAPFRGGPLRFADELGVTTIVDELTRLSEVAGPTYEPCALLKKMAAEGTLFHDR